MKKTNGTIILEEVKAMIYLDHLLELEKYTLDELIQSIQQHTGITLEIVSRRDLIAYPMKEASSAKERLDYCGGPAFIFIYKEQNLSQRDKKSIAYLTYQKG